MDCFGSATSLLRIALALACWLPGVIGAQGEPPPKKAPAAAAPHEPDPRTAFARATTPWTDRVDLDAVSAFCAERGLASEVHGDGPVRVRLCGGAHLTDLPLGLKRAEAALTVLDEWTGSQALFVPKPMSADQVYWLVLFASADQMNAWIDWRRAHHLMPAPTGDVDLAKICEAFPSQRVSFSNATRVDPLWDCEAVYMTACLAADAFYGERALAAPSWIRECLATDLQLATCQRIAVTTIAYSLTDRTVGDSWGTAVAQLIKKHDRQVRPASELMRAGLSGLPTTSYVQMWSLGRCLRTSQPAAKGPANRFAQLINATANGMTSEEAVSDIYGISDPRLSQVWHDWAAKQK